LEAYLTPKKVKWHLWGAIFRSGRRKYRGEICPFFQQKDNDQIDKSLKVNRFS
jgi:hypothetical protein